MLAFGALWFHAYTMILDEELLLLPGRLSELNFSVWSSGGGAVGEIVPRWVGMCEKLKKIDEIWTVLLYAC